MMIETNLKKDLQLALHLGEHEQGVRLRGSVEATLLVHISHLIIQLRKQFLFLYLILSTIKQSNGRLVKSKTSEILKCYYVEIYKTFRNMNK